MTKLIALTALAISLLAATLARAAFPGANGKIALSRGEIYTLDADGSHATPLTSSGSSNAEPAWSADGKKIAFATNRDGNYEIYSMDADGANQTRLTSWTGDDRRPVWSPDSTKIAFDRVVTGLEIYAVDANGTGLTNLTGGQGGDSPAWSPDGRKIAFVYMNNIFVMNADGSGRTQITHYPPGSRTSFYQTREPDWSPDGSKIVYALSFGGSGFFDVNIHVMNADGSGDTEYPFGPTDDVDRPKFSPDGRYIVLECSTGICTMLSGDRSSFAPFPGSMSGDSTPDWQPIPVSYARPKGATPLRVPLVPSFQQCTAPNRTHGAPLSYGSCRFPRQVYPFVTVGTPDANGAPANSVGFVRFDVQPGAPGPPNDSHVYIAANVSDVRCGAAVDPPPPGAAGLCDSGNSTGFPDYGGQLEGRVPIRITDTLNSPDPSGTGPGTMSGYTFSFPVPCATTADTTIGSTCSTATEADAVVPGIVPEGNRAIWQMGQVDVYAADSSAPPDALFETQGVFVP